VLAVLARTDLFALVVAIAWLRHRRRRSGAVLGPVTALAVVAATSWLLGGGFLPDSALPMAWLWHTNHAAADGSLAGFLREQWWYGRPVLLGGPFALCSAFGFGLCVFWLVRPWWPAALRVVPAVLVGSASLLGARDLATPGWAALLLLLFAGATRRRLPRATLALVLAATAIVALHWAWRWYPRDYYVAPLCVVVFATLARLGRMRLLRVAFATAQLLDGWRLAPEPLAGQQETAMAGRFLSVVLHRDERVACFNSGLVTFHADTLAL
jgi:hypothetical protein